MRAAWFIKMTNAYYTALSEEKKTKKRQTSDPFLGLCYLIIIIIIIKHLFLKRHGVSSRALVLEMNGKEKVSFQLVLEILQSVK